MRGITIAVVIALLVACAFAMDQSRYQSQMKRIDEINAQKITWVAGENKFTGKSVEEIKSMLGLIRPSKEQEDANKRFFASHKPSYTHIPSTSVPASFSAIEQWPNCIHPIRNQAKCGSCWAFSASEVLSDRFCISTNGTVNSVLSPQDLVSCSSLNQGCNGGILSLTWMYLYFTGIVPDNCLPYVSGDGHVPACPANCPAGSNNGKSLKSLKHFAKKIYPLWVDFPSKRVEDMQKDLMTYGPQQTGFEVYDDFLHYKSGVYSVSSGASFLGGHAIKIVGWGEENNTPYWLVANSWGEDWGEKGFFKIRRGTNECDFEGGAWAGIPGNHP